MKQKLCSVVLFCSVLNKAFDTIIAIESYAFLGYMLSNGPPI